MQIELHKQIVEHHLAAEDIAAIQAEVEPAGYNTITHVHHPSIEGKDVLALAAVYGGRGFKETYDGSSRRNPAFLDLCERVSIAPRNDWARGDHHFRAVVSITTRDGRKLRQEATYRRMTEAEDLASSRLRRSEGFGRPHLLPGA